MIRWGILGCGDVTERKSGPAFSDIEDSTLVAVMRRDAAKAQDYARRHKVPLWFDNAQQLVECSEVDAVYVAAPPGAHEELAMLALAAGKPCYIEKPMARSFAECQRLNAAFAAAQVPLFVAFYRRGLLRFVEAKHIVESGALGQISTVHLEHSTPSHRNFQLGDLPWRVQPEHAGAGLFLDLAAHALDILDFLFGELTHVRGDALNIADVTDVEDVVSLSFRAGGAAGVGLWNFASHSSRDELRIAGTEGELKLSIFGDEPLLLQTASGSEEISRPNPATIQQPLIQSIVDELHGRGACPSTGLSAARTSRVMDAALNRYYGGRDDDFWQRTESWPRND
ncbi:MAG TPA: Gfo/Idh/MocA family oxidoreductase [Abditibacteriaceae bacterium]|jgi:predicted dehydrogenase